MKFKRVIIVDLASLGIGEASDANRYDSVGANTLSHVLPHIDPTFTLPMFTQLGLFNIVADDNLKQFKPTNNPIAYFGKICLQAKQNSSDTGLREMFDYETDNRITSILTDMVDPKSNRHAYIIGMYRSYLGNQEVADVLHTVYDDQMFSTLQFVLQHDFTGLAYGRITDLATAATNGDVDRFAEELQIIDDQLTLVVENLRKDDLLIVTSTYANDPTMGTAITREYLPLMAYSPKLKEAGSLGIRPTLGDIGAVITEAFDMHPDETSLGDSFLSELK